MAAYTSSSTRRHCPDCDEAYQGDGKFCLVCGAAIVIVPVPQESGRGADSQDVINADMLSDEDNMTAYLDLFGIDFRDLLERFNSSSHNRVISQDYASTLGKIDVDERFTILFNYVIRIGPLKVNSVPANFSPLIVNNIIEAPLIIADPVCGETTPVNSDQLKGSIALMNRGVVSFAQKCKRAKEAGAVGIIIAQSNSKWPFVMADSAGELGDLAVDIPVCMISQTDGELLFKWVSSKSQQKESSSIQSEASSSLSPTNIIFKCDELPRDCSVCQDNMTVGDNVLRLSCCHTFHSECIMTWLHKHNNCPMCRYEMPSVESKVEITQTSEQRGTTHRQNYFA
eukprot:CAMPEP_0114468794 /NCGR_PEP_ID=MMETSP0104-20121206/10372_1 /TAXON_ID=37642 ORGANISM="Paraphysomonas imperforata, Strain PA2" /NCGR_SAMPLE_ID=MMETSP0104 /ASSEMBLY_ACC=CAM_ASM_000202 /LENGTH=340 /DNA_ID=CAMNT_0001642403 /DNA_START=9 /DNA_END=1031 /DNA_ORIENTATION=+